MRKAATIIIPLALLALLAAQFTACEKYVLPEVNVSADTLWFGAAADSQRLTVWTNVITTAEPDDSMLEVAIEALKLVLPEEKGTDIW